MTEQFMTGHSAFVRSLTGFMVAGVLMTLPGCTDGSGAQGVNDLISSVAGHTSGDSHDIEKPVASKSGPWPKAVVEESDYDFGRMRVGSKKDHSFTITNEGDAVLELVAGDATCKCTEFELSASEVPPGESATLFIQWHGKARTASFQHGGPIYTNDPESPSIRFNIRGVVDAPVTTKPSAVWQAGDLVKKASKTFEGLVYSHVLPQMTIEKVTANTELTTAEYEPMTEDELSENDALCGWKFKVTVRPGLASGIQHDTLKVAIAELGDEIEIPVEARHIGLIRLAPLKGTRFSTATNTLKLGHFPANKGRTAELMMVVDQQEFDQELELTEIESTPKSLKVSLEPIGKPTGVVRRYRFTVEVPPGGLRQERSEGKEATIRCRTNHPTEEEILLHVAFTSF